MIYLFFNLNDSCVCDTGYELTKGTCKDVDECLDNPCSDTERCSNIAGLSNETLSFQFPSAFKPDIKGRLK